MISPGRAPLIPMHTQGFAPFVFSGARQVGRINAVLMLGLGVSFFTFVLIGFPFVEPEKLTHMNWSFSLLALPVAFTSFGYQGIIPTLSRFMDFDVKQTRRAIIIGSFLPFVAYVVWQWLILGIVPVYGPEGLSHTLEVGGNAVRPLKHFIHNPYVYVIAQFFAFFALTTSFLMSAF